MGNRQSHAPTRNRIFLLPGVVALQLLLAVSAPPQGVAKGVQPGYFTVKLHEPLPLREVDGSSAAYERVIDAKRYLEAPSLSEAGAHPDLTISVVFLVESIQTALNEEDVPAKYVIQLPSGIVANFGAIPSCKLSAFESTVFYNETPPCSAASQLGVVSILYGGQLTDRSYPLYKINTQNVYGTDGGHLAAIGFPYELIHTRVPVVLPIDLRTDSDYGMTLTGRSRFPEFTPAPFFTFWGDPWASTHDSERWNPDTQQWGASVNEPQVPFITSPSNCNSGVLEAKVQVQYWFEPEHWLPDDPEDFAYRSFLPEASGCETVQFSPGGEISPTTHETDSPTGLNLSLEMPGSGVGGQKTSALKDFALKLPAGISVNPATLNGIDGCTPSQIGLTSSSGPGSSPGHFDLGEAHCPDASEIGIGVADTPLVGEPVKVAAYFAMPYENPFHSLMALYLVFESQAFTVKLAAEVDADPVTGQLTAKMESLPQLPLERLDLRIFDGSRAALSSPEGCGDGTAVAILVPWSAPESGPPTEMRAKMSFEQREGSQSPCSEQSGAAAFAPVLNAGLEDVAAGGYSPFFFRVERPEGSPGLRAVTLKLPRGVAANLQGVPYCTNASIALAEGRDGRGGGALEQGAPSCPEDSRIGSAAIGAGTGPIPLVSKGTVYLAGPYKGAPLSLVVAMPAIAGGTAEKPLVDLGTVVLRVALNVDQRTGRITAVSDPLPRMIEGIPLRIDDVRLLFDRAGFVRGPTSCNAMKTDAKIEGFEGAEADPTSRFQMVGCRHLRFRPRLKVDVERADDRHRDLRLQAVVIAGPDEANISRAKITFPASVGRRAERFTNACSRPLLLKGSCSRRSILGHAVAWSPLLADPVSGPIYATSVRGHAALAIAWKGQVSLLAMGNVSSKGGRMRTIFSDLPDLPLSRVKLSFRGGLLGISTVGHGACGRHPAAIARFTAHSGRVRTRRAIIGGMCAGRSGRGHFGHSKHKHLVDGRSNAFKVQ